MMAPQNQSAITVEATIDAPIGEVWKHDKAQASVFSSQASVSLRVDDESLINNSRTMVSHYGDTRHCKSSNGITTRKFHLKRQALDRPRDELAGGPVHAF